MNQNKNITATIFFKINGLLRFLSHQETARMFKRAISRSGISLEYSVGFNPHPKISLPLPRSVSMASDCEMIQIMVSAGLDGQVPTAQSISDALSAQMPREASIIEVKVYEGKVKFNPVKVTYFLPVEMNDTLREKILSVKTDIETGTPITMQRVSHKTGKCKRVNLTDLTDSVSLLDEGILLVVKMLDGTSVKLDEMPKMFGLSGSEVSGAVVRKEIEWKMK